METYTTWPRSVYMPPPDFNGIAAAEAGAYMRMRRNKKGLTQTELALRTGMPNDNYLPGYEKGKTDWRKSDYAGAILEELDITAGEAREHLGMRIVMDNATPADAVPATGRSRPEEVTIRFLGEVQAATSDHRPDGDGQVRRPARVAVPREILGRYKPEDLYALRVVGTSMVCEEVRLSIPEGFYVALHSRLEPRNGDVVVAWIRDFENTGEGLGVLKAFRRRGGEDDIVLDSYNRTGRRFRASDYPDMVVQGVYVGSWHAGRRS